MLLFYGLIPCTKGFRCKLCASVSKPLVVCVLFCSKVNWTYWGPVLGILCARVDWTVWNWRCKRNWPPWLRRRKVDGTVRRRFRQTRGAPQQNCQHLQRRWGPRRQRLHSWHGRRFCCRRGDLHSCPPHFTPTHCDPLYQGKLQSNCHSVSLSLIHHQMMDISDGEAAHTDHPQRIPSGILLCARMCWKVSPFDEILGYYVAHPFVGTTDGLVGSLTMAGWFVGWSNPTAPSIVLVWDGICQPWT